MKHAAVLYTCVGLMGAAAITGFIDYSYASKSGVLNSLYQEESEFTGSTIIRKKTVELEDYSRKEIGDYEPPTQEMAVNDEPKKKKKANKQVPPPPPAPEAPPVDEIKEIDIAPPPPPIEVTPPIPVTEEVPTIEVVKENVQAVVQPVKVEEVKEVRREFFSRAPLKKKQSAPVSKRKQ